MDTTSYTAGDRVKDTQAVSRIGTVRDTFADGSIVRVAWDGETFYNRESRKREQYVSDISAVRLVLA